MADGPQMNLVVKAAKSLEFVVSFSLIHSLLSLAESLLVASGQLDALSTTRPDAVKQPMSANGSNDIWKHSHALTNLTEEEIRFTPPGSST
eukprot:7311766-Prymnesium_polylepis.1